MTSTSRYHRRRRFRAQIISSLLASALALQDRRRLRPIVVCDLQIADGHVCLQRISTVLILALSFVALKLVLLGRVTYNTHL